MALSYTEIKDFMGEYFNNYSQWVNDQDSLSKLDRYYSPEFQSIAYMHLENIPYPFVLSGREAFKAFLLKGHRKIVETLIPVEMVIDERKQMVVVLLRIEKTEKSSSKLFVTDAMALYGVEEDEGGAAVISSLRIFTDDGRNLTQWVDK